jgi:hypothetical protein
MDEVLANASIPNRHFGDGRLQCMAERYGTGIGDLKTELCELRANREVSVSAVDRPALVRHTSSAQGAHNRRVLGAVRRNWLRPTRVVTDCR